MSSLDSEPSEPSVSERSSFSTVVSEVLLTGVAVIVPIVITVYVLQVVLRLLENALQPVVDLLAMTGIIDLLRRNGLIYFLLDTGLYTDVIGVLSELIALVALFGLIVVVGTIAYHPRGERFVGYFDVFIAAIPGIGTVYKSFRRMGDIMLDDEVENFQEVKLVEMLGEGTYVIGFVVGRSPPVVDEATDAAVTMFVPFAPNPVTGGFLTYVSEDRLVDVDMTVEEGIRNVITSGVAGHETDRTDVDLTADDVRGYLDADTYLSKSGTDGEPARADGDPEPSDGR